MPKQTRDVLPPPEDNEIKQPLERYYSKGSVIFAALLVSLCQTNDNRLNFIPWSDLLAMMLIVITMHNAFLKRQ